VSLNCNGFVVGFYDVFEGFQALAAIGFFTAGACGIGLRHSGAAICGEVGFDFFVVEWITEANVHKIPL